MRSHEHRRLTGHDAQRQSMHQLFLCVGPYRVAITVAQGRVTCFERGEIAFGIELGDERVERFAIARRARSRRLR